MRVALLLLAIFLVAGCTESPASDTDDETTSEDPGRVARRGSSGGDEGDEEAPEWPHEDVVLLSEPIQMVANQPATFEVEIPADTTNITFRIESPMFMAINDLQVALDGCGAYASGGFGGFVAIIGGSYYGGLCAEPDVGKQSVTVENLGFIEGTFEIWGQQPLENETAAA